MNGDLIQPTFALRDSYRQYIDELADEERYPFVLDFCHYDFPVLLDKLHDYHTGTNLPEGVVPSSTYWLVVDGQIIGVSNLRHQLNNKLRHCGGHIGLGIRPRYRGQGWGAELLRLTILAADKIGIGCLHVHCYQANVASSKMIKRNGAVLASQLTLPDSDKIVLRYRINRREKVDAKQINARVWS